MFSVPQYTKHEGTQVHERNTSTSKDGLEVLTEEGISNKSG